MSLSSYFSSAQTLYKKRLQYLESRISQSSCVPKRDFTAYFDDAERFNEQKCLALFRFKMEDINTMVELLGLNDMTFRLSNRTKYTGKEGFGKGVKGGKGNSVKIVVDRNTTLCEII